jgi:alcohol dehydrogenase YqhD (iron-dependent ADH family)
VSRYFTKDMPSTWLGDEFAEGIIRTVIKYAPAAIAKPDDYEARAELMMAAAFSHNDLVSIGRIGPRGGEHPLEHQFSGHYDTAHGAGLAAIIPAWLQYAVDNGTPDHVARVAQFCVKIFGLSPEMGDVKATANAGLKALRAWIHSIGMPLTFEELGIPASEVKEMVRRTMSANNGKMSGFIELDEKAVTAIFSSMV